MPVVDTPKSQVSESLDQILAKWEAKKPCQCDGGESHGHCRGCEARLPEGEGRCEACDLKARSRRCPGCSGSYVVSKGADEKAPFDLRGEGVCSLAWQGRLLNKLLLQSGLTMLGREKTLENFSPQTPTCKGQLEKLTSWKDGKLEAGVFLWGPPGTGKTHLAAALMRALCQHGLNGRFIKCWAFTLRCQASFSNEETLSEIVDDLRRGRFLVLDDIGVEKTTDFVRQSLVYLVDEVLTRRKLLIATSNRNLDELVLIDPRFPDRLVELCDKFEFNGPSYRPRLAKARAEKQDIKGEAKETNLVMALPPGPPPRPEPEYTGLKLPQLVPWK